jgi:hypothetical protein
MGAYVAARPGGVRARGFRSGWPRFVRHISGPNGYRVQNPFVRRIVPRHESRRMDGCFPDGRNDGV